MAAHFQNDCTVLANVARRLGDDAFRRRMAIQREREDESHALISTKGTFLKIHILRPVMAMILKLCGLWGRGCRQLLSPEVRQNEVFLGTKLPCEFDGFRILHLSDLHIDIDERLVESISNCVAPLYYDLCVMTGDYRNKTVGAWSKTISLMERLRGAFNTDVFCVLGNHDFAEMVSPLEKAGYRVLLNEGASIQRGDAAIGIAGVDDPVIFETHDVAKSLAEIAGTNIKILLSHSLRVWPEAVEGGVSLLLAGHTHGGQICLPGGRLVHVNEGMPRNFLKGAWSIGDMQGYTSAGCGASGLPCRLNCPPEVTIHILKRS